MYMLFNDIIFDIIHSVVICVHFLGTHMVNLVLSLKLGVIDWYQSGVDYRTYA